MSKKPKKPFFKNCKSFKRKQKKKLQRAHTQEISSQSSLFKESNAGDVLLGDSMHEKQPRQRRVPWYRSPSSQPEITQQPLPWDTRGTGGLKRGSVSQVLLWVSGLLAGSMRGTGTGGQVLPARCRLTQPICDLWVQQKTLACLQPHHLNSSSHLWSGKLSRVRPCYYLNEKV